MKIVISAESTVDLTKELLEKYQIPTIPFQIFLGDKNGLDGEITSDEIIEYVNKPGVLPKTGAINVSAYEEYFASLLKENDAIVHFSLSSELSSSYNNAFNAAKNFDSKFKKLFFGLKFNSPTSRHLEIVLGSKRIIFRRGTPALCEAAGFPLL